MVTIRMLVAVNQKNSHTQAFIIGILNYNSLLFEPRHEKTNNVISEQVHHQPICTSTEDG